jgi:site-specific recombinase XerD
MNRDGLTEPNKGNRAGGVSTEPLLASFGEFLLSEGYLSGTIEVFVSAATHLTKWAERRGTEIADFDESLLGSFDRHLIHCRCHPGRRRDRKRVSFRLQQFLRYLRKTGAAHTSKPETPRSLLTTEYGVWMAVHQGLSTSSISQALRVVSPLLCTVADDPAKLDASAIRRFVLEYIQQHAPASAGTVTSIVRCFLRWLVAKGRCATDLTGAVPKVPTWQLAKLPNYLADSDVERIVEACARPGGMAHRDRAMVLLLARLGLRASDVVALQLDDIDWKQGRIRVAGKQRRETRLPLPQDVGDAILSYLDSERPKTATGYVFLTARAPIRPISTNGLRDVVRRLIERTGVQSPSYGTHILRHSLATRLLREGATLDTIGAVLRHRDVNTTAIYAKVDIALLRQIAQPWPDWDGSEVSPC